MKLSFPEFGDSPRSRTRGGTDSLDWTSDGTASHTPSAVLLVEQHELTRILANKSRNRASAPPSSPPPGPWLTTAEAAAYLRLGNSSTVRSLVARGELRPDGKAGRGYLFRAETLDAYVATSLAVVAAVRPGLRQPSIGSRGGSPSSVAAATARQPRENHGNERNGGGTDGGRVQTAERRRRSGVPSSASSPEQASSHDPFAPPPGYKPDIRAIREAAAAAQATQAPALHGNSRGRRR